MHLSHLNLSNKSFGFSRVANIELSTADILGGGNVGALFPPDEDGHYRLSWELGTGGWRAGQCEDNLCISIRKLIYYCCV